MNTLKRPDPSLSHAAAVHFQQIIGCSQLPLIVSHQIKVGTYEQVISLLLRPPSPAPQSLFCLSNHEGSNKYAVRKSLPNFLKNLCFGDR